MSYRDTTLAAFKTLMETITVAHGYSNTVAKVEQKMLYWDKETSFPVLMVLGGDEEFEDTLGGEIYSNLHILIRGYSLNTSDPDNALNLLINDVIKAIFSSSNSYREKTTLSRLMTDEGWFNFQEQGFGYFDLEIVVMQGFTGTNP